MIYGLYLLYLIVICIFACIGFVIDAPNVYWALIVLFIVVGWATVEHFNNFVDAIAEFQKTFNQWVREIFKLNKNVGENGDDGENSKK